MRAELYWPTVLGDVTLTMLQGRVAVHIPEVQPEELRTDRYEDLGPLKAGALVAPATASGPGHYRRAIVRATGLGARLKDGRRDDCPVRVGDLVFIGRDVAGEEVVMADGEIVWIILEDDIVARLVPYRHGLNPPVDAAGTWELEPLADRVFVEYHREPDPDDSDLIVQPETYYAAVSGTVLAVGPGWKGKTGRYLPMEVRPGDTIYFGGDAGQHVNLAGHIYWMLREDEEIMAVAEIPEHVEDAGVEKQDTWAGGWCGTFNTEPRFIYWKVSTKREFVDRETGFKAVTHRDGPFYDAACHKRMAGG